jgi:hypothetical protein
MKMRVPRSVLAALCAVTLAATLSPAAAQSDDADLKKALSEVKVAWRDYENCARAKLCSVYFDTFGVGITFSDGTIAPFSQVQRLFASHHECIQNARAALEHGDKALAVQWVMAAEIPDPQGRDWLGEHPDAVIEALRRCCVG